MKIVLNLCCIGIALGPLLAAEAASPRIRTVVLSDVPPPELGDGAQWAFVLEPTINNGGQVAFTAGVRETVSTPFYNSVWTESSGDLELVARVGEPAAGYSTDVRYKKVVSVILDNHGRTLFSGTIEGPGLSGFTYGGLWLHELGMATPIVKSGGTPPGLPDSATQFRFEAVAELAISRDGKTVVEGEYRRPDGFYVYGLWRADADSISPLAYPNQDAPGLPPGTTFASTGRPFIDRDAQAIFAADLQGAEVNALNDSSLWTEQGGTLELLLREGEQAPGAEPGEVFESFHIPRMNAAGHFLFEGKLRGPEVGTHNNQGLWTDATGEIELVLRTGVQAPGLPTGVEFVRIQSVPRITNEGDVIANVTLRDPHDSWRSGESIWRARPGQLDLVIRTGDPAPGLPGMTLARVSADINARNQLILSGQLRDDEQLAGLALWLEGPQGALQLVAAEGEEFEVSPGDWRTISELDAFPYAGSSTGMRSGFNDRGEAVFAASFEDGSHGVFVANVSIVPEPTAMTLIAVGVSLCVMLRRIGHRNAGRDSLGHGAGPLLR